MWFEPTACYISGTFKHKDYLMLNLLVDAYKWYGSSWDEPEHESVQEEIKQLRTVMIESGIEPYIEVAARVNT